MPRFFLETIAEDDIQITGADAHHIGYALRMRPGEHLTVCANNIDYDCVIREITKDTVFLDAVSKHACAAEPSVFVTLYQAVPKAGKLEEIIQKSIRIGGKSNCTRADGSLCCSTEGSRVSEEIASLAEDCGIGSEAVRTGLYSGSCSTAYICRGVGICKAGRLWRIFCMRAAAFGFQKCH